MPKINKLVGVYGTLRKVECNHHVLGNSTFIKQLRIVGYKMFVILDYPAVIKGTTNDSIVIEIYRVTDSYIEKQLDLLEGFDRNNPNSKHNLYTVEQVFIGSVNEVIEIYTFNHTPEKIIERGLQLKSGDWSKRN